VFVRLLCRVWFPIIVTLLTAHCVLASSVTIIFKDGTKVTAELPQDPSQIKSINFESDSGGVSETSADMTELENLVWKWDFANGLGDAWDPIQVVGGNYNAFAKMADGKLLVDVPKGNSWGKTGAMTKKPIFTVDADMAASPMRIVLDLDPAATKGFVVCLASSENNDVWVLQNYWMHWGLDDKTGLGFLYTTNTHGGGDSNKSSGDVGKVLSKLAPKQIVLSVSPNKVVATLPSGEQFTQSLSWLNVGAPVYFHIFSHPHNNGGPGGFALKSVEVGR
jgi:hypothetical protein